jgi:membrane-bound serine protease (ClpP class)
MQGLAKAKGRPPALAEAMVDSQLVVFHVKNRASGEQTIMSAREISSSGNPDQWEKIKPVLESGGGRFLEVVGARAVELGLAQGAAKDREELTRRCGLKGQLEILEPTAVDTAVYILNLRLVTGLLLVIGLVALYIEFSAPGISVGGLIAGLCFALFFWSRFLGGTAGALEVLLFLAGVVFLCVEFFVLPGFGVAGLSGILLVVASLILACQTFVIPTTANQLASFGDGLLVVIGSGAAFAAAAVALTHYLGAIPLLNRLTLGAPPAGGQSPGGGDASSSAAASGRDRRKVQVGDCGVAESPLRPAGKAMFGLEYIDVVTDGSFVEKGRPVRVVEVSGNRVVVREVEEA